MSFFQKIFIAIGIIIVGFGLWYMISPLFINQEVQEVLPEEYTVLEPPSNSPVLDLIEEPEEQRSEQEKETNERSLTTQPDPEPKIDTKQTQSVSPQTPVLSGPKVTHANNFERVDYDVTGSYQIIENNGKLLLRIEGLDITNGPDLHFVLSNSNQAWGNRNFVDIAPLPGNQGSYNVPIPENINLDEYQYLLIHCVQFSHTFASADL